MGVTPPQDQAPFGWLSFGPAVLTAAGVLLYGILNISYSLFYGGLGINPEDVGLTYASTLTRSTGFVVVVVGIFIFGIAPFFWVRTLNKRVVKYEQDRLRETEESLASDVAKYETEFRSMKERYQRTERDMSDYIEQAQRDLQTGIDGTPEEQERFRRDREGDIEQAQVDLERLGRDREGDIERAQAELEQVRKDRQAQLQRERQDLDRYTRRRAGRGTTIAITVVSLSFLGLAFLIPLLTLPRVDQVRSGREVSPVHLAGLTVLAVSADRATIQATGKADESAAIEALRARPLLYLGQAGTTHVFYDGNSNEAVYVPSSSVVVKVDNK